jgi:hypothetical protein
MSDIDSASARDSKTLMNVFLDGEKLFEWEATGAELAKLVATLPEECKPMGTTPDAVAQQVLLMMRRTGRWPSDDPKVQRGTRRYIIYLALTMQAPNGFRLADFAGLENYIDVRFSIGRDKLRIDFSGQTRADS